MLNFLEASEDVSNVTFFKIFHCSEWFIVQLELGVVFPHRNFFPWGMGKNGEGIIFSHGEMGKNGESYFGFKLTKKGIKST